MAIFKNRDRARRRAARAAHTDAMLSSVNVFASAPLDSNPFRVSYEHYQRIMRSRGQEPVSYSEFRKEYRLRG